ncbi:MAG: hypothetical protein HY903_03385 [Deltaproteobacteria bacterium]|nr:hypothetical protein [Deltaproteobacteria bacterium]
MWTRRRARPSNRAMICVAGLAGFVGAQLAGIAHEALVIHVRCPEHGELIDAHPAAALDERLPARPTVGPSHTEVNDRHGGHVHCGVVLVHRLPTALTAGAAPLFPQAGADAPCAAADEWHRPVALVHLAPKTSPPLSGVC